MRIENLHVAVIHEFYGLGGAETVSRDTGHLFASMGIYTHYYCIKHYPEEWSLPDPHYSSIEFLPYKKELWCRTNVDFLIKDIKAKGITLLIIATNNENYYLRDLKASGVKLIYWCHNNPFWEANHDIYRLEQRIKPEFLKQLEWKLLRRPKYKWLRAFEKEYEPEYLDILQHVDCFITLCPAYSRELIHRLRLGSNEIEKLISLTNTIQINPKPQLEKKKKIIYMGRLDPIQKKVSRLIHIWARIEHSLPEWSVEIYGKGEEEDTLRSLISSYQLQRIKLCGYCSNPPQVYREAAIVALISDYEGWGLCLIEAQNNGCVPIAFDCSAGIRQIIGKDKLYGRLVPSYRLTTYARYLRRLCLDDNLRKRLQEACLRRRLDYAPEQNLPRWRAIIESL